MGWFGSLDLAYKYAIILGSLFSLVILAGVIKVYFNKRRLKRYTKKAEEEAVGGGEERVELNKREPDEGDLFGIRAIQSGYFGGVAQSRPSSIAEERSDRDSTASNTLLGSHHSSDKRGTSPMDSVVTLPLEARTSSPLRHTVISAADPDRPRTSKRQVPHPIRSTLQPSDAETTGRINHDPSVNMYLNVPPSPGAMSRPSSSGSDIHSRSSSDDRKSDETSDRSTESSFFPRNSQYGGHYIPTAAPQFTHSDNNRESVRAVSTVERSQYEPQSQHASIVSKESEATIRDHDRSVRSSIQEENNFTARPASSDPTARDRSSIQEEDEFTIRPALRPISTYRLHPPRTSSHETRGQRSSHVPNGEGSIRALPVQTSSAEDDWGSAIFHDIDRTIQDSKDASRQHTSHLSDSSSIYTQRQSAGPEASMNPYARFSRASNGRGFSQDLKGVPPSQGFQQQERATAERESTRRGSDTSSRLPASTATSTNSSHRNTRDLGDFYDSHWQQSNQGQKPPQASQVRPNEEKVREARRQDQLASGVPAIDEVPSPVSSPAARENVGVAM